MEKTLDIEESSLHKKPITKTYTYEEAIAATGVGRFHYFLLLVSGALMVAAVVEVVGL
uniref:Uncharacterized protein n=1 Tax=Megaselia scalaris TaxID=36166 RepID=T1GU84_MEGSC